MRIHLMAAALAATALAGCDNNPDFQATTPPPPAPTISTVLELARSLIGTRSCETSTPAEINGRELTNSETPITDLGTVSVGCSG